MVSRASKENVRSFSKTSSEAPGPGGRTGLPVGNTVKGTSPRRFAPNPRKGYKCTKKGIIGWSYWNYLNTVFTGEDTPDQAGKNKRFWSYIKHQNSSNTGVAPLKKDGHLTSDPKAQAELLNKQFHFQSVLGDGRQYTAEEFELKTGMADRGIPTIDDIKISEQGVKKFMENLSLYKAGGPDGISSQVLRELAEELAPAQTIIFQSSLSTGIVPADWRDAYVTPIFKKGKRQTVQPWQVRPISLTCIVCKLMEHIVVSSIMQHFETHCILIDNQHGFRRGCSCETQLLEFLEELTTSLEGGRQIGIIILDFAKASTRWITACLSTGSSATASGAPPSHGLPTSSVISAKQLLSTVPAPLCQSQIRSTSGVHSWPVSSWPTLMTCQRSWWICQVPWHHHTARYGLG